MSEAFRPPPLEPPDEHNHRLLDNVHPATWVNPQPAPRYHLVVIGAGTAGLVCAAAAAGLGARVALVERHLMGGDCLNVGCVPSKALLRAARAWHDVRDAKRFGGPDHLGSGDFGEVMRRLRRLRADLSRVDSAWRFRDLGVDVFLGEGRFAGADVVEVAGARLRFRRAVVATGGRAATPDVPGLESVGYLTNETVFNLTERPRRLAIIGGGPIGCELAQAFARFGVYVTLLSTAPQVLHREDPDAAAVVARALERDGVRLELGTRMTEVRLRRGREGSAKEVHFQRDGQAGEFVAEEILVAVGRTPNLEALNLPAAGIVATPTGVKVNDRLRTTNRRVYAAGDAVPGYQFTHNSDAQARIVVQNALFPFLPKRRASSLVMPWCTYTDPEIAHVGLYERDAAQRGVKLDTLTIPLADVDRAVLEGAEEGFLRLHLEKGGDRILGATLVAAHAGDMLGELCLAVTHRVGLGRLGSTIHPYPTQGEVVRKAADAWRRARLTPAVKRLLRGLFWMTE